MKINTREIDRILNRWLKAHGYTIRVFASTEFAWYWNEDKISYVPFEEEEIDTRFMAFAKSLGLRVDCGSFIVSFFHELGHYETEDDLDYLQEQYCEDVKDTLDKDSVKDLMVYFNLDDEKMATQWAVDFINENVDDVGELAIELSKAFTKFYKRYGIKG